MRYNEHIFKSRMHLKGTILYVVMFQKLRKQIKLKVHTSTGKSSLHIYFGRLHVNRH